MINEIEQKSGRESKSRERGGGRKSGRDSVREGEGDGERAKKRQRELTLSYLSLFPTQSFPLSQLLLRLFVPFYYILIALRFITN